MTEDKTSSADSNEASSRTGNTVSSNDTTALACDEIPIDKEKCQEVSITSVESMMSEDIPLEDLN